MKYLQNKTLVACVFFLFSAFVCWLLFFTLFPYRKVNCTIVDPELAKIFRVEMHHREGVLIGHGEVLFSGFRTQVFAGERQKLQLNNSETPISFARSGSELYVITFNSATGEYTAHYSGKQDADWLIISRNQVLEKMKCYDFLPNVVETNHLSEFMEDYRDSEMFGEIIGGFYSWLKTGRGATLRLTQILTPEEFGVFKNKMDSKIMAFKKNG